MPMELSMCFNCCKVERIQKSLAFLQETIAQIIQMRLIFQDEIYHINLKHRAGHLNHAENELNQNELTINLSRFQKPTETQKIDNY